MFCALITDLTLAVILVSNVTKTVSYLSINPFDESNITGQISANELLRTCQPLWMSLYYFLKDRNANSAAGTNK